MNESRQALPVPNVAAKWREGSRYPETIWVEMSDGMRIRYEIKTEQPGYQERKADAVGYGADAG